MICDECNTKNTKNANFCTKCGKKLGEDNQNANANNINSICNNLLKNIKGMIVKPIDTAEEFIKDDNYMTGLLYLGINIIGMALFILVIINSCTSIIGDYFGYGTYGNYNSLYSSFEIPYFKIFLIAIMFSVITYGLLASLPYLISKYGFKSNTSFQKMITWLGINSIFNTMSLVVVAIAILISVRFGTIVYLMGSIVYTFNLYRSLEYTTDTDKNKLCYILMPTLLITLFVVIIVLPEIFI